VSEPVLVTERDGAVALLTLNRPDRSNAWTGELESAYYAALAEAENDPGVLAVVVTGAGRAFCVGADLDLLADSDVTAIDSLLPERRFDAFPPLMSTPVVAAVNGSVAGVGLAAALQCDLRFLATEAKVTTAFTRRGLVAEHGMSWLLPQLVGRARALDLLLSGRTISGEEAGRIGLAEFVLPAAQVLPAALAYAHDLAAHCSPTAMAVVKAQLRADAGDGDPVAVLGRADALMRSSFTRPDVIEGISAWLQRRPPAFGPLDAEAVAEVARLQTGGAEREPPRRGRSTGPGNRPPGRGR
jgi:enoyl-CoA hydratase/carnithine racemase